MRYKLPLAIFLLLAMVLAVGLSRDPRRLPSALVGKAAPAIDLPLLEDPQRRLQTDSLRGQVWLLNVWASWCAPCREELPVLQTAARRDGVLLYGLNYKDYDKDQGAAARAMLQRHGNPYRASAVDAKGRVGIDFGVYGVPETFVIDREGRIRLRHPGAVTAEIWQNELLPLVRSLQ